MASTSDGSVNLLRVTDRGNEAVDIKEQVNWKQIHKFKNSDPTSCTGLSTYDEDIVTIGEDGRINLLTSRRETLVRTIGLYSILDISICNILNSFIYFRKRR